MTHALLKYFKYSHLPAKLQTVSKPLGDLAEVMASTLPEGPELDAGLRKLLEAKDCFVRAALEEQPARAVDLLAEQPPEAVLRETTCVGWLPKIDAGDCHLPGLISQIDNMVAGITRNR